MSAATVNGDTPEMDILTSHPSAERVVDVGSTSAATRSAPITQEERERIQRGLAEFLDRYPA